MAEDQNQMEDVVGDYESRLLTCISCSIPAYIVKTRLHRGHRPSRKPSKQARLGRHHG